MRRILLICGLVLALVPACVAFVRDGHTTARPQPMAMPPLQREARWHDEFRTRVVRPKVIRFDWPATGSITGVYGNDNGRPHPGIDIGMLRSLKVRAAAPGRVLHAGYTPGFEGYGDVVVVRTGHYTVLYAHLSRARVHPGELVRRDEPIGTAGCTGYCTGTHLHFEVRKGRRTVNPTRLLASAKAS